MELGCSHDGAAPAKNSTVPRTRRVAVRYSGEKKKFISRLACLAGSCTRRCKGHIYVSPNLIRQKLQKRRAFWHAFCCALTCF